jgi:SAM-dependent methyltransferase
MTTVRIEDLLRIVTAKLELEGTFRSFRLRSYTYAGRVLAVDSSNSMLFEFPAPAQPAEHILSYRLLLCMSLHEECDFAPVTLADLTRIQKKDGVDKIVLWSSVMLDDATIHELKAAGIDVLHYPMPTVEEIESKPIRHFVPIQGEALDYSLRVNHIAEYLVKRCKQLFHLVLSEISAPIFDEQYAKDKVATRAVMRYEENQLGKLLRRMVNEGRTGTAVDVGCGTGRHSFMLARYFSDVYAFDFSPKMIAQARAKQAEQRDTHVRFSVGDFEYERIRDEHLFHGTCDLVVASFGMGSFIEDTAQMLRRFHDWLKPGGYLFVSFYNENSITLKLTPTWRDTSFSADIDAEHHTLKVELPGGIKFNIFCRPFNDGTRGEINKIFNIDDVFMYPTVMALLPNELLQDRLALRLFSYVDEMLADTKRLPRRSDGQEHGIGDNNYGYYVIVVAHKPESPTDGYANIQRILEAARPLRYDILEHQPVLSAEDFRREIGRTIDPGALVKTIIFKDAKTDEFIVVVLASAKMVDKDKLAGVLGIPKRRIKFASEKEVLALGFPVGGIAPFGWTADQPIRALLDATLQDSPTTWFYTGVGDNKRTLKIEREGFLRIVAPYERVEF